VVLKRDEQRLALLEKWNSHKEAVKVSVHENTNTMFGILKRGACEQMVADAARFTRLGNSDETIYTHLVGLMAVYRRIVELAEGEQLGSPSAKALLVGICEVLNSRIRDFDVLAPTDTNAVNPVLSEKKIILDKAVETLNEKIDEQSKRFAVGLRDDIAQEWDESFDIILQGEFYELFVHYRDGLRFCLSQLDDLHARQAIKLYTQQLEREWEELGNIIRVQVQALEAEPDEGGNIIPGILDALREAYQQTGPIIDDFQKLLQLPPVRPAPCCPFSEFESRLNKVIESSNPPSVGEREFFVALADEIAALFGGLSTEYMKSAYKLQRTVSEEVLLAEEVVEAFAGVLEELPDISQEVGAETAERDILAGIVETIEIKIESLKESTQTFNKQGLDMVRALAVEKPEISEEERQAVLDEARKLWQESPPDENSVNEFFELILRGEAFAPCHDRISKQIGSYFEKSGKASFRFKKEVLLYEVCTYEEILTHSVSRLRAASNEVVASAAVLLDETFRVLEVILKKNNIAVIKPEPHQPFDAKEHEVIVAEKQEGFERGEIIKLVTAGYRQSDQIILRANVIAAR